MQNLLYISALLLVLLYQPAIAADGSKHYTIDEVAAQVQKDTGAQILSAEVSQGKQGKVYRFKIKKKGRIKVLLMYPDGTRVKR